MLASIRFMVYLLLVCLPWTMGLRQFRHDSNFQPDYILRVGEETTSAACRTRLSAVVNGTTPGPTLYMKENQTTWVRVYNDFRSENLTMHWHGLSQSVSPWSDGTPQASQWPIKAQHFFDYEIRPQIGEAGSYFYHSHIGFQAVTATGPLVVHEAGENSPYDYESEKIIFLSELFNWTDATVQKYLTAPISEFGWTGEAASILVNGNGYLGLPANETETSKPWAKPDLSAEKPCSPEIIEVEPDTTYRFRTIGGVSLSPLVLAFEDHDNLTIIAADARYTQPASTDLIQIASGQRYDFIIHTKSEEELQDLGKSMFWMQIETRYRDLNDTFYAILSYKTNASLNTTVPPSPPTEKPVDIPFHNQDWLEYTLQPREPNGFPTADQVTRQVVLVSSQIIAQSGAFWTVNNRTWTEDNQHEGENPFNDRNPSADTPYLVDVYRRGERAVPNYETAVQKHGGWDPDLNVYPAKIGEVIDIILINEPNGVYGGFDTHPWHIHGDHVYDLGCGSGTYNATENEERLKGYNPIQRDTSLLFKYVDGDEVGAGHNYTCQGWRAWRVKVQNPGVWMIHCHILQHMIMGMEAVWVMGNASEITRGTTPELVEGYLSYGGNAYGNSIFDPLVSHYFDD
ncbi:putative multi-copper oxidase [Talaromyces proteolyticus]|uniref:Multi-copper oxidase n=1 Tax=Talaromyces proteolyticus TaxID=1131652 RepID=A0AAD4Q4J6_9EURO|nr:putative multi-copper oxidase [Talaromyces proteolyticus]KAH8703085.1 putative multi-copper oxidase [Talaromyces proteolyticus]